MLPIPRRRGGVTRVRWRHPSPLGHSWPAERIPAPAPCHRPPPARPPSPTTPSQSTEPVSHPPASPPLPLCRERTLRAHTSTASESSSPLLSPLDAAAGGAACDSRKAVRAAGLSSPSYLIGDAPSPLGSTTSVGKSLMPNSSTAFVAVSRASPRTIRPLRATERALSRGVVSVFLVKSSAFGSASPPLNFFSPASLTATTLEGSLVVAKSTTPRAERGPV